MEFDDTPAQAGLRKEIQDFIAQEVTGKGLFDDDEGEGGNGGRSPALQAVYDKIKAKGWRAISWPKEYGGQDGNRIDQYIIEEEFSRAGLSVGGGGSGAPTILAGGTQEQKDYYVRKLVDGEYSFALGFTEPSGGADLAGLQCRAVRDGDDFVINGQKMYTSSAHRSTHLYLMARTDPESKRNAGISIFLIPMDTPGITVRPLWTIQNDPPAPPGTSYGVNRTNETFFEDVRVPASCLLGEENNGWNLSAMGLNLDRVGASRYLVSVLRDEDIVNWVKDPENDDLAANIKNNPAARDRIAEQWIEGQVCRLMTLRSMSIVEHNGKFTYEGSAEKVWSPEHGVKTTETIAQLLGPYAQLLNGAEDAIESGIYAHNVLGAFQSGINHGSTQIMRDQVAQRGLGLPRNR